MFFEPCVVSWNGAGDSDKALGTGTSDSDKSSSHANPCLALTAPAGPPASRTAAPPGSHPAAPPASHPAGHSAGFPQQPGRQTAQRVIESSATAPEVRQVPQGAVATAPGVSAPAAHPVKRTVPPIAECGAPQGTGFKREPPTDVPGAAEAAVQQVHAPRTLPKSSPEEKTGKKTSPARGEVRPPATLHQQQRGFKSVKMELETFERCRSIQPATRVFSVETCLYEPAFSGQDT